MGRQIFTADADASSWPRPAKPKEKPAELKRQA
jgi:hypothetical protein